MLYRQIILEWGQDTESGVWGLGYSPDNGKNFYVLNTIFGRKYRQEDADRLWEFLKPKISTIKDEKGDEGDAGAISDTSTDFNNLTSEGHYDIRFSPNTGKNGPNEGNWGLLDVKVAGRMVVQTYYGDINANVYVRNCHDGTTWTAWREITF
ncbi:pyocin knob domain-containing protein [Limosilactobacillus fermentum]|uniref:pyocin knob domain-containing protein n=1 Tax=Limosilactobacillus fermentum TaxID=1613 RepID=UPI003FA54354